MMIFGQNIAFWVSVIGASVFRILLTPWMGLWHTLVSFCAAMFFALVFTDPVLSYLNLNPENYRIGVAAVVALTGEGIAKRIIAILADQKATLSLIRLWRGQSNDDDDDNEGSNGNRKKGKK